MGRYAHAADSILESAVMAIYRLLQHHAFEPEAIMTMTAAYDQVLHTLCLAHRSDPITWIVAEKVIQFAQRGERERWSRFFEQNFRVDKWNLCRD